MDKLTAEFTVHWEVQNPTTKRCPHGVVVFVEDLTGHGNHLIGHCEECDQAKE